MTNNELEQRALCMKYGVEYFATPSWLKIGISESMGSGILPINGLRHPPAGDTAGWYLWSGDEPSQDNDYFKPLHVEHLPELYPGLMKFLGLPPGWRFQVAPDHEDVWFDSSLL